MDKRPSVSLVMGLKLQCEKCELDFGLGWGETSASSIRVVEKERDFAMRLFWPLTTCARWMPHCHSGFFAGRKMRQQNMTVERPAP